MQPRPENDLVYILLILEAIGKIEIYSKNFENAASFYENADQLSFNAVLLLLANIGEQVGKISKETKNNHPHLFWQKIKSFRNRVVHDYTGIDFEMVFDIVKKELTRNALKSSIFDKEDFETAKNSHYYRYVDFNHLI